MELTTSNRDEKLLRLARKIAERPGGESTLAMLASYSKDDLVVIKHLGKLTGRAAGELLAAVAP